MARGKRIRKTGREQKVKAEGDAAGDSAERFNGQLPPIMPAMQWPEEFSCRMGKDTLRRLELTNRAYSAAVYAHTDHFAPRLESLLSGFTKKLFRSEKEELLRLFEQECFAALGSVREWLRLMRPIHPTDRIAILKDYQGWGQQVRDLVREAVFAGEPEEWNRDLLHWAQNHKPDEASSRRAFRSLCLKPVFGEQMYLEKFSELFFAQMQLEERLGLMNDVVRDLISVYEERVRGERRAEAEQELNGLGQGGGKKRKITLAEANIEVGRLLKETPSWEWTVRKLAAAVKKRLGGGSVGTIGECPVWKAYDDRRRELRKNKRIKTVSLTSEMKAVLGVDGDSLPELIAEQEAEDRDDTRKAKLYLSHEKKPKRRES
jgi:hypothetical protein